MKYSQRAWNSISILFAICLFSTSSFGQTGPDVTLSGPTFICIFDCANIDATVSGGTAPYTYLWYLDGNPTSFDPSFLFCPFNYGLGFGTYVLDLEVTDSNGFTTTSSLTILVDPCPQLDPVIEGPVELCSGECGTYIGLDAGGGYISQYAWYDVTGILLSTSETIEYCPTFTTSLILEIYDDFGYSSITEFIINVIDNYPLEIVSTSPTSCPDNGTTSACDKTCANSTISYIVPGAQGLDLEWEVLGAESYEVDNNLVTVDWGNPGTGEINVTTVAPGLGGSCALRLNVTQIQQSSDIGGGGVASASVGLAIPPISYEWSNNYVGNPATGLYPGTYQVTATDATGLSEVGEVIIEPTVGSCNNTIIFNSSFAVHPSCPGGNDGYINIEVLGGTFSYLWSTGSTTQDINGIGGGNYCVTVTDANNDCEMTNCYTICDPSPIYINAYAIEQPSGPASAGAQAWGGAGNYSFLWCNGETANVATDLDFGPCTVVVTDDNGCTASETVFITYDQNCFLTAYAYFNNNPSSCNTADGTITVGVTNASTSYDIQWEDGSSDATRTDLLPGTYCVTVVDVNDCEDSDCVTLYCNDNLTSSAGCTGLGSLCIDIIEEPQAQFSTEPVDVNGLIEICRGESVTFHNESDNAENYVWELGDGYSTSAVDVTHAYTQSGLYSVLLIARNECFCIDTTSIKVLVSDSEIPEIECVGTVCENATQTYTTTADCNNFVWTVGPNGTISAGGGLSDDYVTVDWGSGPVGEVSLQVSSCNGDYCANPTSIYVPIITDGVFIEGPTKVCPGEIGTYMVPQWSATEYVWSASPFGEIKSGQGTNTVNIKWNVETVVLDPQWVHVEYNNCFLECGGESTKDVNITPDFYLAGPIEVCESSSSEYAAFNEISEAMVPCNWTVADQDGTVIWTSPGASPIANIDWPTGAGKYTLTAVAENPDDFCSDDYTIIVSVVAGPPQVIGIDGQNSICPGEFYTYSVNSNEANVAFSWQINNGGILSENAGDMINVQWGNTPPYELTVTQISTAGLACVSAPFTMTISPISSISLNGPDEVCIEGNYQYTAPTIGNAPYNWTISPSDAGTILSGQDSDTISVLWSVAGAATLSVNACGASEDLSVTVFGYPDPVVIYPDSLCSNETGLVSTTTPFSSYSWKDEDGTVVSNASNPNLSPGYYELEVTNNAGCIGQNTFSIHGLPAPVINITTPGLDFFCVAAGLPIPTLYAINTDEGYTFEWFRNNVPLGIFADSYTPTQGGNFYVQIIDINGCSSLSNTIFLYENCPGGGGPPAPGTGCSGVDNVFSNTTNCEQGIFENTSTNYVPGSVQWDFDDPASGANNYSNLDLTTHSFTSAGFYGIEMSVTMATGGTCIIHKPYEVPAQADFDVISNCPGQPVQFEDLSTFTPGTVISEYFWEFGDSPSPNNISFEQNPTHIYENPGTYLVSLSIEIQGICYSFFSKTIEVLPPPTASYQMPDISCATSALPFEIDLSPDITSFEWNFGDPASGPSNTSRLSNTFHAFSGAGTYDVQLTVFNIYGCSDSISMPIVISENDLSGDISMIPGSPICEGSSSTLSAPPGGTSWVWSDGSTTESIIKSEAGVYDVTITNDLGCIYIPPSAILDIIAQPEATIKVTEYNEYGQPADCFFDGYILCEGEDVFLSISGAGDYAYEWSSGQTGDEVIYDNEHDGTLPAGDHDFEVTITDNISGCTSVEGPFTITVNPVPTDIMITSFPQGPICEQTNALLAVSNPDTLLTYLWSTGEYGITIQVSTAGEYFVRGISAFGCEGESNIIEIYAAPDINLVPDGCHTRCAPDTICLPTIPDVVAFQWYLDEVAIPAPEGTDPDFTPTESGAYSVALFDVNGCSSLSNPFSIDLLPLDTSSLSLNACEDGTVEYAGEILLPGTETEFTFTNQMGCDSTITVTVTPDTSSVAFVSLSACSGSSVIYEGETYFPGTDTTVSLTTTFGCDSIINLTVTPLPTSEETLNFEACSGTSVIYAGQEILAGTSMDFTFVNQFLCDSLITVVVNENLVYEDSINLAGCEGSTINYEGIDYPVGTNEVFSYSSDAGCDSIIYLNIASVTDFNEVQNLSACAGTNITLPGGLELAAGTDTTLFFTSQSGCDSTVQFIVESLESYTTNVDLSACDGDSVIYEGTAYPAGTDISINLSSQGGCDSTILLTVESLAIQTGTLQLAACDGTTVEYAGQDLEPGTITDVVLVNQFGCDSTITVTVVENQTYYEQVDIDGCNGETIIYDGVQYDVGTTQEIDYLTVAGCDSTILLVISGLPLSQNEVELFACPGGTAEYVGDNLAIGTVTEYTFPNQFDCDSIVEVTVSALPSQNETVMLSGCEGSSIIYDGVEYLVGGPTPVLTYVNQQGCDSTITLNIQSTPSFVTPIALEGCLGELVPYNGLELEVGSTTEIELSSTNGCDSLVVITVNAFPTFDFETTSSDLICWNANEGEIEISSLSGGTAPFEFSLDGINYQSDTLLGNIPGGNYTVYVKDANDCVQEDAVSIPVTPPLEIAFNVPTIACDEDSVSLVSVLLNGLTDSMVYQWQHGPTGTDIPIYNPGNYIIDVTNLCETQSFEVAVDLEDGYRDNYIYIPNAFSPNGDGRNDIFKAYAANGLTILSYELHLFDRWGNTLYTSTNIDEGWNGVFLDEAMNPGVYVWWLRAKVLSCRNEIDVFEKGDITIMK